MTLIGNEEWEFIGAEGGPGIQLDPAVDVALPVRWRIFGPLGPDTMTMLYVPTFGRVEPRISAAVESLTSVPDELPVGDVILKGRDVEMPAETPLDLADLFGTYDGSDGHNAYAMAEMEVDREADVVVRAACDNYIQFWIDGRLVMDTLDQGSCRYPFDRTDYCFRHLLTVGKHVLAIRAISGSGGWHVHAAAVPPGEAPAAMAEYSDRWDFVADGDEIFPPWDCPCPTLAVRTDLCLADETIEFEYQQDYYAGYIGIIFGARDSDHYYFAYVPRWGQLQRARAVYAAIGKADGSGYIRNLRMQLMPNIPMIWDAWGSLKVERRGEMIRTLVNGVEGPCVMDGTYGPGRVGIGGVYRFRIRNLKIDGSRVEPVRWQAGDRRRRPWYLPIPEQDRGEWNHPGRLFELSDDEILMMAGVGSNSPEPGLTPRRQVAENTRIRSFLSRDQGRTWARHGPDVPSDETHGGLWFVPRPGVIRAVSFEAEGGPPADSDADVEQSFFSRESTDKGLTWSRPVRGELLGRWDEEIFVPRSWRGVYGIATLRDGTLLMVLLRGWKDRNKMVPNVEVASTWGTTLAQPYCTVSRDQGQSWSQPVPMDHAVIRQNDEPKSHCGGFSETAVAQLPCGRIVAIARPVHSPFMWQTQSEDGGSTWRMACYAPFSGAGGPQLVATRSGYLAMAARCVGGVGMHISIDGGVNWDHGTTLDNHSDFNGSMLEVEPDVVIVVYPDMADGHGANVRAQRIRITPQGPVALDQ